MKKEKGSNKLHFNKASVTELNSKALVSIVGGSNNTVYDVNTDVDPTSSKGDTFLRTQTLLEQ
jgi:hypothetical protein